MCKFCLSLGVALILSLITDELASGQSHTVTLNELLARNQTNQTDQAGDFEDWLELYNAGTEEVDVAGFYLTDELFTPALWQFPTDAPALTTLSPGEYLLIWLDEEADEGPLHASFKLSGDGETLALFAPDGRTLIDSLTFGPQHTDISFGRTPDGGPDRAYFTTPTPGSSNTSSGLSHLLEAPTIVPDAGFHGNPILVSLAPSEPETALYYTLDGRPPTESNGIRYTGTPISIDTTTVLRVGAFAPGRLPGPVVTQTYFIGSDHTMPVVSLTTHPDSLFHPELGIHVPGPNAEEGSQDANNRAANFWLDREPPAHIEYFDETGALGFSQDMGVRIFGGISSRYKPKKSFQIRARGAYGSDQVEYPMFADKPHITSFDGFILRASTFDWGRFRNEYIYEVARRAGGHVPMQAYKYVVLYLNGTYWGVFNLMERKGREFIEMNFGETDVDFLAANREVIAGDTQDYDDLLAFLNSSAYLEPEGYEELFRRVDLDNLIDYWIFDVYQGNRDNGNIRYFRPRRPEGQWRFISYDNDQTDVDHNTLEWVTRFSRADEFWLLGRALQNESFRDRFIRRFADLLNTEFRPEALIPLYDSLAARLRPEMGADLERWGTTYYPEPFADNPPRPLTGPPCDQDQEQNAWTFQLCARYLHAENRPEFLYRQIREFFDLSGESRIELTVEVPEEAPLDTTRTSTLMHLNSLDLNATTWSGRYFQDVEVVLEAVVPPGYVFAGWSGDVEGDDLVLSFVPTRDSYQIRLRLERPAFDKTPLVFNEISYNASEEWASGDWVELYNPSESDHNLAGWYLKDDNDDHVFAFSEDHTLEVGGYLVLCEDPDGFDRIYPEAECSGVLGFGLDGDGDAIRLFYPDGDLSDIVLFSSASPWPSEADGTGATLELLNPNWDNSQPSNWKVSDTPGGSPGTGNTVFVGVQDLPSIAVPTLTFAPPFPNPTSTTTTFTLESSRAADTTVELFDALGRRVSLLFQGPLQPQVPRSLVLDVDPLSGGIYVARVTARILDDSDRLIQSRHLVVVKQ